MTQKRNCRSRSTAHTLSCFALILLLAPLTFSFCNNNEIDNNENSKKQKERIQRT